MEQTAWLARWVMARSFVLVAELNVPDGEGVRFESGFYFAEDRRRLSEIARQLERLYELAVREDRESEVGRRDANILRRIDLVVVALRTPVARLLECGGGGLRDFLIGANDDWGLPPLTAAQLSQIEKHRKRVSRIGSKGAAQDAIELLQSIYGRSQSAQKPAMAMVRSQTDDMNAKWKDLIDSMNAARPSVDEYPVLEAPTVDIELVTALMSGSVLENAAVPPTGLGLLSFFLHHVLRAPPETIVAVLGLFSPASNSEAQESGAVLPTWRLPSLTSPQADD